MGGPSTGRWLKMIRRISKFLIAIFVLTIFQPVVAPSDLEQSEARSGKTTICHRTHSVKNPYRRITVSNSSLNSGHKKHTGGLWTTSSIQGDTWGDIIPDATAGGDNTNDLNFTGDVAGQAIWRGQTINPANGGAVCKGMTMKAFYDSEKAAGQTDADIVAELKDAAADEDLSLLQTLSLTFSTLTSSNLATVVTSSQAIIVTTLAASSVGVSTATLNGSAKTDSTALTCHFEYGTNSGFVPSTLDPAVATSVTLNTTNSRSLLLSGLAATTKYYYRLVCHDSGGGDLYGETVSFTTGTTYTIAYDSNTAFSGTVPSDYTLYSSSETAYIRGNEGTLIKTGFSFSGWTLNSDGSGTVYSPSATTTIAMTSNRTLYAKWTATTFPVSFDSNTATSGSMSNQTYTAGTAQGLTSNAFSKTGYTFNGWNTAANGGGTSYTNSQSVTLYETTTVYAQWTAGTYAITFDSNTANSGTMSNQSFTAGTPFSLTTNGFTKTGFTFAGWATTSGGSVVYSNTQSVTLYAATTLYAKWTAGTYAITFDSNTANSGTMSNQSFTAGTPFSLTTNGFTKTGFTFAGWATTSGGSVVYSNTQSMTLYAATTLYAKWTANTYAVTFNINSGTSGTMSNQSFTADSPFNLTTNGYSRTGYTFAGWATTSGGSVVYSNTQSVTLYAATTLYAKWTAITYTITYDSNTATSGTVPASGSYTTDGAPYTVLGNTGSLVLAGNTFSGWNSQSDGSGTTYTSYSTSADITLYAIWTNNATYRISYSGNGNTNGSTPASQTVATGNSTTVQSNSGSLLRTGYTFLGWYSNSNGTGGTAYTPGVTSITPAGNLTLYANWSATSFPVSFDSNTATSGSIDNQTYTAGIAQTLTANSFAKTGYSFTGWNTAANGTGTPYSNSQSITLYETTTVYAQWNANTFLVTFDSNTATSGSVSTQTFTAGTGQALTTNSFAKTGFTFAGWASSAGGSVLYSDSQSVTLYETATVFAKWTGNNLTVRYFANGGSGSMGSQTIVAGTGTALTTNSFSFSGYSFTGWNTVSGGTGTAYSDVEVVNISSDTDLYAQWSSVPTYTITYTAGGGSGTVPTQSSLASGATFTAGSGSGLSRSGYTFAGWSCNGGSTVGVGVSVTMTAAAMTCVAQWTAVASNSNGNSGGGSSATVAPGKSSSTPAAAKKAAVVTLVTVATTPVKATAAVITPIASTPAGTTPGNSASTPAGTTPGNSASTPAGTTPGNSASTPAGTTPGNSASTPAGTTPGNSASTPAGTTPGNSASTPAGTTPGNSASTPAGTTPGNSASTPAGTTPGNSASTPAGTTPGNSASTPAAGSVPTGSTNQTPISVANTKLSQTTVLSNTGTTAITFKGLGINAVTVKDEVVSVAARPGFSGKTTVAITLNNNEEISSISATVWVLPLPVTNPVVKPLSEETSRVNWVRSPNAIGYEVIQDGKVICTTSKVSCVVNTLIALESKVEIKALGRDQTESLVKEAKYVEAAITQVVPDIALVVNFDTAKFNLDAGDKALIRAFAAEVVKYRYTSVDITGHTDSRGGIDNNVLSNNRAKAARDYLLSLVPTLKVTVNGFADAINVATNQTAEGMAANRRAEFRVVG